MKKLSVKAKTVMLTSMTIFALLSTMCACFAWFTVVNPTTHVEAFSGSLDVSFKRISAFRYVYPYFSSGTTYVDYGGTGKVKETILLDESEKTMPTSIVIKKGAKNLSDSFYLIGDNTFLGYGDVNNAFNLDESIKFTSGLDHTYSLNNVTLSKGSIITIANTDCKNELLNLSSVEGISDNFDSDSTVGYLYCKKAGLYDFLLDLNDDGSVSKLTCRLSNRNDEAVFGMTLFDPTYAKLNGYDNKYPAAIHSQNTLLIYDITLDVKNQYHDFKLKCDVRRNDVSDLNEEAYHQNLSSVVGFSYSFEDITDVYDYFHKDTSTDHVLYQENAKYFNDTDKETSLSLFSEDRIVESDSAKEASEGEEPPSVSCHFYIAVEYNPNTISYFFDENRLGKEYDLKRDFTFYFSTTQATYDGGNP